MPLSASQLEAFARVVRTRSFSLAAKQLHLTQSALSQRVLNLESEVGTSLIVRDPAGLRLTAAGEELLRYHGLKESLEIEALSRISGKSALLEGPVRVGAFSSALRSLVMPSLTELLPSSGKLQIELFSRELRDLPGLLYRGEADCILTVEKMARQGVESIHLGDEENVLIEPAKSQPLTNLVFDHDPSDQTTAQFFKHQSRGSSTHFSRGYLDEIYAIIDAVSLGWGRAVVPEHLIIGRADVRRSKGYRPLLVPVFLSFYTQRYSSRLHDSIREALSRGISSRLQKKR